MITINEQAIQQVMDAVRNAVLTAKNAGGMHVKFFDPENEPALHHAVMLTFQALALPGTYVKSDAQ